MTTETTIYNHGTADVVTVGCGMALVLFIDNLNHPNHPLGGTVTSFINGQRFSRVEQDAPASALVSGF